MMGVTHAQSRRPWSRGEEIANSVSHGIGLLAALIAVPLLLAEAARRGDAQSVARAGVFGLTILLVYLASTLFHALPDGRAKRTFEVLDNAAVFLLIAGTYTPLTLGSLRGAWGLSLFAARLDSGRGRSRSDRGGRPALPGHIRLSLSWHGMAVSHRSAPNRADHATLPGLLLVLAGGLAYTAGLAFWAARRLRYHHLVWHLFVLLGTGCHFLAILWYAT